MHTDKRICSLGALPDETQLFLWPSQCPTLCSHTVSGGIPRPLSLSLSQKMSATFFARVSLPPYLPSQVTRFRSLPTALLSVHHHFQPPHVLALASNRRPTFLRSMASDGIPESVGVPRSVPVRVAHELLQAGHRYLDVRTVEEFNAGHAVGAKNIPYMFKSGSGMTKNLNFLKEVSTGFGKEDEIVVGCLSGKRSLMAATELLSAGFTRITDIEGGYSAWTQNGLPTEQ